MKLNKNTRELVKVGTILKYGKTTFEVVSIQEIYSRYGEVIGKQISVKWLECSTSYLIGCINHAEKLSNFYGYEIINN